MPVNYIVTCGTSQLEKSKLITLGFSEKRLKTFLDAIKAEEKNVKFEEQTEFKEPEEKAKEFYRRHESEANNIIKHMDEKWKELPSSIGHDRNPFGAEISTLVKLANDHPQIHGNINGASITILTSASVDGYFCAEILSFLLKEKLQMSDVTISLIPGMVENPESNNHVNETMKCLIDRAFEALIDHRQKPGIRNVIIITGGFKSVSPCLTLFATLYGLEMVYLFERSSLVQTLTPMMDLKDKKKRDPWVKSWKFVLDNGNVDDNSYVYHLLRQRNENSGAIFYASF